MRTITVHFCTVFILLWVSCVIVQPAIAQTDCDVVGSVQMPVDTESFTLVQEFAVRSIRHEGRFHTGEDWYGGRGDSVGQPVRAVANGRVTFSSENGWGADGGVVILEHTLPDDSIFYTQYGHIDATAAMPFPARLACVNAGDIIGVIGDVRPAPHLHFEVRIDNPSSPGPGYMRENPYDAGWRDPGMFITGLQSASYSAYLWQITVENDNGTIGLSAPPFLLNDDSLLYLTRRILRRITPDGRILWRQNLEKDAVSITGIAGETHLTYSDGTMERVDADDGVTDEVWRVDANFTAAPIVAGDWLLFPAENNQLIAIDETRRNILWTLDDVPPVIRSQIVGSGVNFTVALLTQSQELLYISGSGGLIDRAQLQTRADFSQSPENNLLLYSRGGIWQVDVTGQWSLVMLDAPPGQDNSALYRTERRLYLYDGDMLTAYNLSSDVLWQSIIPEVTGRTEIYQYGTVLLMLSSGGTVAAMNDAGMLCNRLKLPGDDNALVWHNLDEESSVLRIATGSTIIGIEWTQFTANC